MTEKLLVESIKEDRPVPDGQVVKLWWSELYSNMFSNSFEVFSYNFIKIVFGKFPDMLLF